MKYVFMDYPEQSVIVEGQVIVKNGTLEEVLAYAEKIKGEKLPFYLTRPTSWRHIIVGTYSLGATNYSLKTVEKVLVTAPLFAFIEITILMSGRRLPRRWMENAFDIAHGGNREFEVYDSLCNRRVAVSTVWDWLNSDIEEFVCAGVCTCANRTDLPEKFYKKCEELERLEGPFTERDVWFNGQVEKALDNMNKSSLADTVCACF